MTVFHLVRHARHVLQGRTMVGRRPGVMLGPEGRLSADRLAARLARESIVAVYSSPLERALDTARAIARRLERDVEIAGAADEVDFGDWTGRTLADLEPLDQWRRFNLFRSGTRLPGGETQLEVQARMVGLIERLCLRHPDEAVVVVSHGDVIKSAIAWALGMPIDLMQRIEISPASLSILEVGPWGPRLVLLNACLTGNGDW